MLTLLDRRLSHILESNSTGQGHVYCSCNSKCEIESERDPLFWDPGPIGTPDPMGLGPTDPAPPGVRGPLGPGPKGPMQDFCYIS